MCDFPPALVILLLAEWWELRLLCPLCDCDRSEHSLLLLELDRDACVCTLHVCVCVCWLVGKCTDVFVCV